MTASIVSGATSNFTNSSSQTPTVTTPANGQTGDFFVWVYLSNGAPGTVTPPSGFASVLSTISSDSTADAATLGTALRVYTKPYTGSEGANLAGSTANFVQWSVVCFLVRDSSGLISGSSVAAYNGFLSSGSHNNITTGSGNLRTYANQLVVSLACVGGDGTSQTTTIVDPSGATSITSVDNGTGRAISASYIVESSTGSTNYSSYSTSNQGVSSAGIGSALVFGSLTDPVSRIFTDYITGGATFATTSVSTTFNSKAGDILIAAVRSGPSGSPSSASCADGSLTAGTLLQYDASRESTRIFYKKITADRTSDSVTVTYSSSTDYRTLYTMLYRPGTGYVMAFDQQVAGPVSVFTTSSTTSSYNIGGAGVAIALIGMAYGTGGTTTTIGSSFNKFSTEYVGNAFVAEKYPTAAASSQTTTVTASVNEYININIISFTSSTKVKIYSNGTFQSAQFIEETIGSGIIMRQYSNSAVKITNIVEVDAAIPRLYANGTFVCPQFIEV